MHSQRSPWNSFALSTLPEFKVMSSEILSDVTRNFIECMNLKKSNILSKSQFMVMSHEILSPVARSFIECMDLKKGHILSKSHGINS